MVDEFLTRESRKEYGIEATKDDYNFRIGKN